MTEMSAASASEFGRNYAEEQLRRSIHPVRRFVKSFYLRNILGDVRGPTIDFGCGAGQLLERLPPGSMGLEVNPYLIKRLLSAGLTVHQAQGDLSDFELGGLPPVHFRTLVIAHVLEHLPDPVAALETLLAACRRLDIGRVVLVVPGARGFASDRTHKTFIDRGYIEKHNLQNAEGFVCNGISYFPGPWEWLGRCFAFHEMKIVFDRSTKQSETDA